MYTPVRRTSGRAPSRARSVRGQTRASPVQLPTSAVRIPCGLPSMRKSRMDLPGMPTPRLPRRRSSCKASLWCLGERDHVLRATPRACRHQHHRNYEAEPRDQGHSPSLHTPAAVGDLDGTKEVRWWLDRLRHDLTASARSSMPCRAPPAMRRAASHLGYPQWPAWSSPARTACVVVRARSLSESARHTCA